MLVLIVAGFTVVYVMLLGNFVQSIDAWISPRQTFFQLGAWPQVLISWPMKLYPCLFQHFLHVKLAPLLSRFPPGSCTNTSPFGFCFHWVLNFFHSCLAACLAPWLAAPLRFFFFPGVGSLQESSWICAIIFLFFLDSCNCSSNDQG